MINAGNKIETGQYWQMRTCDGHDHVHDRSQPTAPASGATRSLATSSASSPGRAHARLPARAALQRARALHSARTSCGG